jgi:hypothetical protein
MGYTFEEIREICIKDEGSYYMATEEGIKNPLLLFKYLNSQNRRIHSLKK